MHPGDSHTSVKESNMKHEAKFSVILPADNFTSAQIETFEQTAIRYKLPVTLPVHADSKGNLVISSDLSLREAQMLRRQVAGLGFPADVISSVNELSDSNNTNPDTLVVNLAGVSGNNSGNTVGDMTSDAWASLELPSSMDLGLSDGAEISKEAHWSGENWLNPEDSNPNPAERTLSLNAHELLKVAQESAKEAALSGFASSKMKNPPSQNPKFNSVSQNPKFNSVSQNPKFNSVSQNPNFNSASQGSKFPTPAQPQKFNSASQGSKFPTPAQNSNFNSASQNPKFSSASQNPKFNSASQNPKFNSASQNPKFNSASQNPKFGAVSPAKPENKLPPVSDTLHEPDSNSILQNAAFSAAAQMAKNAGTAGGQTMGSKEMPEGDSNPHEVQTCVVNANELLESIHSSEDEDEDQGDKTLDQNVIETREMRSVPDPLLIKKVIPESASPRVSPAAPSSVSQTSQAQAFVPQTENKPLPVPEQKNDMVQAQITEPVEESSEKSSALRKISIAALVVILLLLVLTCIDIWVNPIGFLESLTAAF